MYRVMIVEDEIPIRDTIIESVNWQELGFEMVFGAGDGQEALDYLEENEVDLIITDIYMPFVDGLQLVKAIREKMNLCKVIFLTGFNEFEYAKEAVELDASRYLLKPITKDELVQVLRELYEEIHKERNEKRNLSKLEKEYETKQDVLREKLIYDIISGYIPMDRINSALRNLDCTFTAKSHMVGIIEVINKEIIGATHWDEDYALLHYAVYNISKEIIQKRQMHPVLIGDNGRIIVLFMSDEDKVLKDEAYQLTEEVVRTIRSLYNMTVCAGLGDAYDNMDEIHLSFKDANVALEYKVIEGVNKVIIKSDIERSRVNINHQLDSILEHIGIAIRVNNQSDIEQYLTLFFESLRFNHATIENFKSSTFTLISSIYQVYNQMGVDSGESFQLEFSLIEKVLKATEVNTIKVELFKVCYNLSQKIKQLRDDDKLSLIFKSITYIDANYQNPSLSLELLCDHFHVSSSYFGREFKRIKNQTILEYITKIRMDKARELLKTSSMKVFEISEAIGYDDPNYFSYSFRKNEGLTPLQYRKG